MEQYHFIGIGGVGMSALARILLQKGKTVRGSDLSFSYVLDGLKEQGAELFSYHSAEHIEPATTVIYSTDIKKNHPEFAAALDKNRRILHRSELLAELMQEKKTLLVAGTHGKTTTSSLLAHVLVAAGLLPSYAIGGIVVSLKTNGGYGEGPHFVAEADESDGSFLNYPAFGAILTNIEADHLDYWKNEKDLIEGFKKFSKGVQSADHFFWCAEDPQICALNLAGNSYGFSKAASVQITSWRQDEWRLFFSLKIDSQEYHNIEVPLIGRHNALNSAAVFGLCLSLGLSEEAIRKALRSFQGVKRRAERKGEKRGVTFLDDYGHHPTELQATIKALKKACGERRLVVAFQPHRYTRTRDLWSSFPESLKEADLLFLTTIYSAREAPIEGITGESFFEHVKEGIAKLRFGPKSALFEQDPDSAQIAYSHLSMSICAETGLVQKSSNLASKATFAMPSKAKNQTEVYFAKRDCLAEEMVKFLRPHDVVLSLGAGDITSLSQELLAKEISPLKIAVLGGGRSSEHEVSLNSARNVLNHLHADFYKTALFEISRQGVFSREDVSIPLPELVYMLQQFDLCMPILHGAYGEDGMIQGFLQTLGIPYTGSDYRAGPVTMDKVWTKRIAQSAGIEVAPFFELEVRCWEKNPEMALQAICASLNFPLFVKPVHLGSTIGVGRAENLLELSQALRLAFTLDYKVVIEKEVEGKEVEIGLIGNDSILVSDPGEIEKKGKIHTYDNKYGAQASRTLFNTLPLEVAEEGRRMAKKIYELCGCSGFARIDFFLTPLNQWILNEVNPIPGCTLTSAFPELWKNKGLTFNEVLQKIVISGLERARFEKRQLKPL